MTAPTPPARQGRWTAALVLLLVGIAGLLAGVAIDRAVLLPRAHAMRMEAHRSGQHREHPRRRMQFRDNLDRQLDLTPEQRVRIDSLMDAQLDALDEIRDETQPRIESVIAATRRRVDSVLTPEQRERAAELGERRRGERRRRAPDR